MTELQYDLIENFGYKEFNTELLKDYWAFKDYPRRKFTFSLKDLITKYQFKSESKLHNIVKNCGHLKFSSLLDCGVCTRAFKIDHRKNINFDKEDWFKEQLICDVCKRENIDSQVREQLSNFQNSIPLEQKYNLESPYQELDYLEKIFLYVLLTTKLKITDGNLIHPNNWKDFQALEANGVEYILKSIIDKGYIFISNTYDDVMLLQNELRNTSDTLQSYLAFDTLRELKKNLNLNFYNDIVVVLPKKCSSTNDWIIKLYNEIVSYEIKLKDIKQIEEFITIKRLNEVYALIDFICRQRHIPIKKNNALELDLIRMLKKYDLQHVWSIIYYQAKLAASELYDMEFRERNRTRFSSEHVFPHQISSYLNYLEAKNIAPKYPRNLPESWAYSEIEIFVSAHIIKNYETWEKYTPREILVLLGKAKGIQE